MDYLIGGRLNKHGVAPCPGYPKGRVINLYGKEASGKTTLALTACAQVIKSGGCCVYIDWEHEVEIHYAEQLGVPVYDQSKFALIQPETLEDGFKVIVAMAQYGVDLIVLDSVGAGMPDAQLQQKLGDEGNDLRMGLVAARWSTFFPKMKMVIAKTGVTVIGISQIRDKIGGMGYGEQITVQGGNAWKFYPSVRIYLRPAGKEKSKVLNPATNEMVDMPTGMKVKVRLDKCKVSDSAHHEMEIYFKSGSGVDDTRSLVEMGISHKFINKSGSWFEWITPDGDKIRGQGMEKFIAGLLEVPNFQQVLMSQIQTSLGQSVIQQSTFVDSDEDILDEGELDQDASFDDLIGDLG